MAGKRDDLLIRLAGRATSRLALSASPACQFKNTLTPCKTLTDIRGSRGPRFAKLRTGLVPLDRWRFRVAVGAQEVSLQRGHHHE